MTFDGERNKRTTVGSELRSRQAGQKDAVGRIQHSFEIGLIGDGVLEFVDLITRVRTGILGIKSNDDGFSDGRRLLKLGVAVAV